MNTEDQFQIGNPESPIDVAKFRAEMDRLTTELKTVESRNNRLVQELQREKELSIKNCTRAVILMDVIEILADKLKS